MMFLPILMCELLIPSLNLLLELRKDCAVGCRELNFGVACQNSLFVNSGNRGGCFVLAVAPALLALGDEVGLRSRQNQKGTQGEMTNVSLLP